MSLNFRKIHQWILGERRRSQPIEISMLALIDECEKSRPHADWSKLRELPYADLLPLENWIRRVFSEEPSPRPLKGFWFGLFNPCPDDYNPVADLRISGSKQFSPNPKDNRWAVGSTWWPNGGEARSKVLADLYRIAYRQGATTADQDDCLGNDAEYPMCLGYGLFAVKQLLQKVEPSLLLGESDSIGVAVGFDDGDFALVGALTNEGLRAL